MPLRWATRTTTVLKLIPPIAEVPIAETRTCVRPVSFDGLPLHGPIGGIDGLVLACGHRSHGLTWGRGPVRPWRAGFSRGNGIRRSCRPGSSTQRYRLEELTSLCKGFSASARNLLDRGRGGTCALPERARGRAL